MLRLGWGLKKGVLFFSPDYLFSLWNHINEFTLIHKYYLDLHCFKGTLCKGGYFLLFEKKKLNLPNKGKRGVWNATVTLSPVPQHSFRKYREQCGHQRSVTSAGASEELTKTREKVDVLPPERKVFSSSTKVYTTFLSTGRKSEIKWKQTEGYNVFHFRQRWTSVLHGWWPRGGLYAQEGSQPIP